MAEVCSFSVVKVTIPKHRIKRRLREFRPLSRKEYTFFTRKLVQIEAAQNKLSHVRSLVEKIRIRGYD